MKAKLGIAPIAWSNDDLPELGGDTPLQTCLRDAAETGYLGVETGGKFPTTVPELRAELDAFQLRLCSGWYAGTILDSDLEAEKDRARGQLELFIALDSPCLVYGETAGTIQNVRSAPLSSRRRIADEDFPGYGRRLTAFAEHCAEQGMPIAVHHHMGTVIETEREVDLLMNHTGEAVRLCFDAGHIKFAGGDPLRMIDNHAGRILHVHTKDVRVPIMEQVDREGESFLDAVLKGVFTVPGDGDLDFAEIVQRLGAHGYEGWFVVEAEQDPAQAPPRQCAEIGHATLVAALEAAGYEIEGR